MAEVVLTIGDRQHRIACKAGSEAQVRRMGAMLDERWPAAHRASGGNNGERSMLFVALMLADALDEAAAGGDPAVAVAGAPVSTPPAAPPPDSEALLARIADRLESLAAALEEDTQSA
ncbi:MAG: hypothetical protein B7Y45_09485 [Sphingomonas sp. 28-66-16]|nr:MAG: hypothetical protein B7Y45_09485 [Sphingomonas sp. 28-66-16]